MCIVYVIFLGQFHIVWDIVELYETILELSNTIMELCWTILDIYGLPRIIPVIPVIFEIQKFVIFSATFTSERYPKMCLKAKK